MFKVGDEVQWVSNGYPHYLGKTATITRRDFEDGCEFLYINWHHFGTKEGEQGPWYTSRFKPAPKYTTFEQSVLDYIKGELRANV